MNKYYLPLFLSVFFASGCGAAIENANSRRLDMIQKELERQDKRIDDVEYVDEELAHNVHQLIRLARYMCEDAYDPETCARKFPRLY
jgi:septal ring factor EnvC (AmiA/AmiB activator)